MSEKMSINVEVPGINATHNFLVPDDMEISKMLELIIRLLKEEYSGTECSKLEEHMLVQKSTGKALALNGNLSKLGIVNGERLILI